MIVRRTYLRRCTWIVALVIGLFAGLGALLPTAGSAAPEPESTPASDTTVPDVEKISVALPAGTATEGATASVFDIQHEQVGTGPLAATSPGRPMDLALPPLSPGIYTVVWQAGAPSEPASGWFSFAVDPKGSPAELVTAPKPAAALRPLTNVLVAWVPWIAIMAFVGVLMLRFAVTAPTIRQLVGGDAKRITALVDRRLVRAAALALAVFVPATVTQLAFTAGGSQSFAWGRMWSTMTVDGPGRMMLARLVVTGLAALVVVPAAVARGRMGSPKLMLFGLVLGLLELLGRILPTQIPANKPRTFAGDLFTYGHIVGAAIWIGGLVGLVALSVRCIESSVQAAFWPVVIRRFSLIAMGCVGVVTLSGLWLYFIHVANVGQLATTLYGRTLAVKLLLVAALVGLGALNHIWLKPHLHGLTVAGRDEPIRFLVNRRFRQIVGVEVVLGLAVLFVVPYLSGSARNQAFQADAADISRTVTVEGATVTLTPSGLTPGLVDYQVQVAGASTAASDVGNDVRLAIGSKALGVPMREIATEPADGGLTRAVGMYTPMVGDWDVRVTVDGSRPAVADFVLPVVAKAAPLPRSPAPTITVSTWINGLLELLAVVGVLVGSAEVSRRLAQRRVEQLELVAVG